MSKMIQFRNVQINSIESLKPVLLPRGRSLSDYLLEEIRRAADRPTLAEMANVYAIGQKRLQNPRLRKRFEPSETDSDRA